jgi:ferredoxin-NADP reductase
VVIKNQHIAFRVKHTELDAPGYTSVFFEWPASFNFTAGDWIDLEFPDKQLKGGITYSLSSSPSELDLRISFRNGISEVKKALQSLPPNDTLFITQYGNDYDFALKNNRSSVLIAGGIGIAPFRSMLKEMADTNNKNTVTLIYLHQSDSFLFKQELDSWSSQLPNIAIHYIVTKDISRKKREKLVLSLIKDKGQNFYISGPPGMVENNEHLLIDAGVPIKNIRIDSFGGY